MESIVAQSDRDTVEEVFSRDSSRLWRAVFAFSGDREIASDAVAEAFAQVLRRGDAVIDVQAWVWTVAFRIAAASLKTRGETDDFRDKAEDGPDLTRVELVEQLRKLPPGQRASLILHYYVGYSTPEIGRILGSSAGAVRVQMTRGRRRLRALLESGEDV
jgi:RNA polymerase sigma-70 factor (ECF subfamily)